MMKKVMLALSLCMMLIFAAGCGNGNRNGGERASHNGSGDHSGHEAHGQDEAVPDLIKVDLQVPTEVKVNELATITARVTQNDQAVDDADKVEFEYWLKGEEQHQQAEGSFTQDGTYQIERTFDKAGTYNVISHVTARDMHSMPKKQFEVKS
ncbi:FixH family protein [Paenibacillus popilliae]|nr:FixH family protein [Paenibacillus popilliae]